MNKEIKLTDEYKYCNFCYKFLDLWFFNVNKASLDWRSNFCKECTQIKKTLIKNTTHYKNSLLKNKLTTDLNFPAEIHIIINEFFENEQNKKNYMIKKHFTFFDIIDFFQSLWQEIYKKKILFENYQEKINEIKEKEAKTTKTLKI